MPYLIVILPQALWNGNEHIDFIVGVFAIAFIAGLLSEIFIGLVRASSEGRTRPARAASALSRLNEYGPGLRRSAYFVSTVGAIVGVLSAAAGIGSIQSQVGLLVVSAPLSMASALVGGWPVIGVALLLAARLAGQITGRRFWLWVAAITLGQLVESYLTAITATLMAFATSLMMIFLLFGMIRVRSAVAAVVAVLLVWPLVYDVRNDARQASGVSVSSDVGAFDRLRLDQQVARAAEIEQVPLDLGQPGPVEMLRFGLIPRFLDPDRPTISTGIKINVYLGGSSTSGYSFLPVTTAYVLGGPLSVGLWYAFWAFFLALTLRGGKGLTVTRIVLVALVLTGPLGWFSTFPDRTISVIQFFVSSLPILLFLAVERALHRRRAASGRAAR
ncbi:hypothetical protein KZC51_07180 [Microbacterium sp. SSW1-49]|uniref:Uncharacterized protein n=1 Tax=Microbacterium croceum TaxID=2851645 RepID=A0ABT0FCX3_9MICO|nr:hypothetical protein [Microbacterium croceum]MCK2035915.1 hypothetical protein [Microbacterium croceum]